MGSVRRRDEDSPTIDVDSLATCLRSYPVSMAVLFGSRADATDHPFSDVDVAVSFETSVPKRRKLRLMDEMTVAITEATGIETVDLVDLDRVGPELGYEVLSKGRLLFGDGSEAAALEATLLLRKLEFESTREEWRAALADRIEGGSYGRTG